ncbi:MFS general substrate transporter [Nemania sp. NC0429]|nr:MFS general substrate transporter [Nemania sp. NC0429]
MGSNHSRPDITGLRTRDQVRQRIRKGIDQYGFHGHVFAVTASGFFTDSYILFATNVILPSLAFVYWPSATGSDLWRETLINSVTLGGSFLGQIIFGYLTDRFGRTRLYGVELVIVIMSTIAFATGGSGYDQSLNILAWFGITRFFQGVGIGAEYPMSAVLCAEWASTQARARMMAAVFLMQPVGQLVAQLVGLAVLEGYNNTYNIEDCTARSMGSQHCGRYIDSIWRLVIGLGAIPALLSIYYRFRIGDPGLYELDVKDRGYQAIINTIEIYPEEPGDVMQEMAEVGDGAGSNNDDNQEDDARSELDDPLPVQFSSHDIIDYFWTQGNWRSVAGTSLCWFLLDLAFYGIGINSPRTLAKIWTDRPVPQDSLDKIATWNTNAAHPEYGIYQVLRENAVYNLATVCIGSVIGSILLILIIDYVPRKQFLTYSFLWLAALFIITGGSFFAVFHNDLHGITIVLIALCHFSLNLGPNTLTFIIPAEIFPTRYRATCHGIAAAAGKLGSVIITALGWVFIVFGFVMALGAFFSWTWIPSVQHGRDPGNGFKIPSKTLEVLGEGLVRAKRDGEITTMGEHLQGAWSQLKKGLGLLRNKPRL